MLIINTFMNLSVYLSFACFRNYAQNKENRSQTCTITLRKYTGYSILITTADSKS